MFYVVKGQETNTVAIKALRGAGIEMDYWEDLIDVARQMGISVKAVCRFLAQMNVDEVFLVFDEFESFAADLSDKTKRPSGWSWWVILTTYAEGGQRSIDKTWDILRPAASRREATDE